ncbi:MAG: 23S rRNA pseudouridine(955/2504/2580) synthase RluC [Pseudomonadota bacterium]
MAARDAVGSAVRHVEISDAEAGQRIDNYLLRLLKGVPKSRVYRILRKGEVRVNKGRVGPSYRLADGDIVRVPPVKVPERGDQPVAQGLMQRLGSAVIHEDKRLLVLDKPAGVAVHGGSGISAGVIEGLRALRGAPYMELVHRLDRETSGCLLIALKRSELRSLHELIREGQVEKRYLALVRGDWQLGQYDCTAPLHTHTRHNGERHVTVQPGGKSSLSRFSLVESFGEASLVEIELVTGRTHQIRVHAAHLGHPLAGDPRYGDQAFNARMAALGLDRLFLHAHSVAFTRPADGSEQHFSAPLDDRLRATLDRLA